MKHLLLIGALCCGYAGKGQALSTGVKELAALKILGMAVTQDYQTMTTGVDGIGTIRATEYALHSDYYGSLDTVNRRILADPKLAALQSRLASLISQLQSSLDYWRKQPAIN